MSRAPSTNQDCWKSSLKEEMQSVIPRKSATSLKLTFTTCEMETIIITITHFPSSASQVSFKGKKNKITCVKCLINCKSSKQLYVITSHPEFRKTIRHPHYTTDSTVINAFTLGTLGINNHLPYIHYDHINHYN